MTKAERPVTIGEEVDRHGVSAAFLAMAEMLERRSHVPLKDKVIIESVGPWVIAMNGTTKAVAVNPEHTMGHQEVPPIHAAIFYNGWLAGELSPAGGWIAAAMGDLKPCPFCGRMVSPHTFQAPEMTPLIVQCHDRECPGSLCHTLGGGVSPAAWNRRAPRFTEEEREAIEWAAGFLNSIVTLGHNKLKDRMASILRKMLT